MDEKHVEAIRTNLSQLVDVTQNIDEIIELLEKKSILNAWMVKYLMELPVQGDKVKNFYEIIQGRGPEGFSSLLDVLQETNNFRAENLIKDNLTVRDTIATMETKLSRLCPSEDGFDASPQINLEVKVHPEMKYMDIEGDINNPSGVYKMRSKPRGLALIINIYRTPGCDDRLGSKKDVQKLKKLFDGLGYKVDIHSDLTLQEMKDTIVAFSSNPELAYVDSTAVFIMCHGKQFGPNDKRIKLFASDGGFLNSEDVIKEFFSEKCSLTETSERKPILFFFQACRDELPEIVETSQRMSFTDMICCFNKQRRSVDETEVAQFEMKWISSEEETEAIVGPVGGGLDRQNKNNNNERKFEDTFVIFSTVNGTPALRNKVNGSWFVDKFCEIVAEYACTYDFNTLLEMVDDRIRKMYHKEFGYQSIEVCKIGVSKKLYFNPGL